MEKTLTLEENIGRNVGSEIGPNLSVHAGKVLRKIFGQAFFLKDRRSISRECLLYRSQGGSSPSASFGYCTLNHRTKCMGRIQACENPEALKQYLFDQGLGWKMKRNGNGNQSQVRRQEQEPTFGSTLQSILDAMCELPKPLVILIALGMSVLVSLLNHAAGPELSSSIFYLIPISLVTWFAGRWLGILMSIVCTLMWFIADLTSQTTFSYSNIPYWNGVARFSSFLVFALILAELKRLIHYERESSRIDFLTRIRNRKSFIELADLEIKRASRDETPFSVVYVDLDNFKLVNDCMGHSAGDKVLRMVAEGIQTNIRATDTVARLGGDEFAILLPQTGSEIAQMITERIRRINSDLMQKYGLPVTLSMGVVTFTKPPSNVDDLLKISDALMYAAKRNGKDSINYQVYGEDRFSMATFTGYEKMQPSSRR